MQLTMGCALPEYRLRSPVGTPFIDLLQPCVRRSPNAGSLPRDDQIDPLVVLFQRYAAGLDRHPAVVADLVERLAHFRPVHVPIARQDEAAFVLLSVGP